MGLPLYRMNYRDVVNAAYAGAISCPCVSGITAMDGGKSDFAGALSQ
jgi:hypothetical protein